MLIILEKLKHMCMSRKIVAKMGLFSYWLTSYFEEWKQKKNRKIKNLKINLHKCIVREKKIASLIMKKKEYDKKN